MKRYDFDWGYVGIEQRECEDGEWVRYVDALAHYSKELDHAYAEGRKDEADENGAACRLIDAWVQSHGKPIPWAKAVEITAIVNKMPDAERARLLALDEAAETIREETVYEKSARWAWPDGRPDL